VCWARLLEDSVAAGAKRLGRLGLTTSEESVASAGDSTEDCGGLDIIKVAAEDFLEFSESARLSARGFGSFFEPSTQSGGREESDGPDGAWLGAAGTAC